MNSMQSDFPTSASSGMGGMKMGENEAGFAGSANFHREGSIAVDGTNLDAPVESRRSHNKGNLKKDGDGKSHTAFGHGFKNFKKGINKVAKKAGIEVDIGKSSKKASKKRVSHGPTIATDIHNSLDFNARRRDALLKIYVGLVNGTYTLAKNTKTNEIVIRHDTCRVLIAADYKKAQWYKLPQAASTTQDDFMMDENLLAANNVLLSNTPLVHAIDANNRLIIASANKQNAYSAHKTRDSTTLDDMIDSVEKDGDIALAGGIDRSSSAGNFEKAPHLIEDHVAEDNRLLSNVLMYKIKGGALGEKIVERELLQKFEKYIQTSLKAEVNLHRYEMEEIYATELASDATIEKLAKSLLLKSNYANMPTVGIRKILNALAEINGKSAPFAPNSLKEGYEEGQNLPKSAAEGANTKNVYDMKDALPSEDEVKKLVEQLKTLQIDTENFIADSKDNDMKFFQKDIMGLKAVVKKHTTHDLQAKKNWDAENNPAEIQKQAAERKSKSWMHKNDEAIPENMKNLLSFNATGGIGPSHKLNTNNMLSAIVAEQVEHLMWQSGEIKVAKAKIQNAGKVAENDEEAAAMAELAGKRSVSMADMKMNSQKEAELHAKKIKDPTAHLGGGLFKEYHVLHKRRTNSCYQGIQIESRQILAVYEIPPPKLHKVLKKTNLDLNASKSADRKEERKSRASVLHTQESTDFFKLHKEEVDKVAKSEKLITSKRKASYVKKSTTSPVAQSQKPRATQTGTKEPESYEKTIMREQLGDCAVDIMDQLQVWIYKATKKLESQLESNYVAEDFQSENKVASSNKKNSKEVLGTEGIADEDTSTDSTEAFLAISRFIQALRVMKRQINDVSDRKRLYRRWTEQFVLCIRDRDQNDKHVKLEDATNTPIAHRLAIIKNISKKLQNKNTSTSSISSLITAEASQLFRAQKMLYRWIDRQGKHHRTVSTLNIIDSNADDDSRLRSGLAGLKLVGEKKKSAKRLSREQTHDFGGDDA